MKTPFFLRLGSQGKGGCHGALLAITLGRAPLKKNNSGKKAAIIVSRLLSNALLIFVVKLTTRKLESWGYSVAKFG